MDEGLKNFSLDFFKLKGKVAIVTGGNTGLGQAYSAALAKAGADLFIVTHNSSFDEIKEVAESQGVRVEFYKTDLSKKENAKAVVDKCIEKFGKVDILINNAGTIKRSPLLEYKDEDWKTVIDINLNAVYYLSMAAASYMVKQKSGKIVNVCSMLSFQGGKFVPAYTASKHAVAGLTKAFASELAAYNVQTNGIAPGYIETANTEPIRKNKERSNEILSRIPANHWAKPSELMGAMVFLCSSASDYVNGHILAVDGGWLVR